MADITTHMNAYNIFLELHVPFKIEKNITLTAYSMQKKLYL